MKKAIACRLKSKTYWAALVLSVLAIFEVNSEVLALLLPPSWLPYWPLVFPLVMLAMREITNTALSDK